MILDITSSLKAYLETRMVEITGSPNMDLDIYLEGYPSGCAECCVMLRRVPGGRVLEDYLDQGMIEVWARHANPNVAFTLLKNLDLILSSLSGVNLTSSVRLIACSRNAGPNRLDSEANSLVRFFMVYAVTCGAIS